MHSIKISAKACLVAALLAFLATAAVFSQDPTTHTQTDADVRVMTIPISIFTKEEIKQNRLDEFVQSGRLSVIEAGDEQEILSIRSVSNQPLALALLIQDDLSPDVNLQLSNIKKFITRLPKDSRVMVAYVRGGVTQIRQPFTRDLAAAADSVRAIFGSPAVAPRSPYESLRKALDQFDGLPNGRRAVLMISDGVDISNGVSSSSPGLNPELDRAIIEAQRRGVAVYAIFSTATYSRRGNRMLILNGQSSLVKMAEQTGGRSFFQGFSNPVSYEPFLRTLDRTLNRQFAITYLSTHMDSGFYKVDVKSSNPDVEIDHPRGYYFRRLKK